jgi:hypothetical protein
MGKAFLAFPPPFVISPSLGADLVMAMLITALHVFIVQATGVDDRTEPGHDDGRGKALEIASWPSSDLLRTSGAANVSIAQKIGEI